MLHRIIPRLDSFVCAKPSSLGNRMDPSDQRCRGHIHTSTLHFSHGTAIFSTRIQRLRLLRSVSRNPIPLAGHARILSGRAVKAMIAANFPNTFWITPFWIWGTSCFTLAADGLPVQVPAPLIVLFDWANGRSCFGKILSVLGDNLASAFSA
jgi:hypothetical protein